MRRIAVCSRRFVAGLLLGGVMSTVSAQDAPPARAFSPTTDQTLYPLRDLGRGIHAVLGDSGQGAEGRPNAGFVETRDGIVVVGGLASPAQARAVIRTIRTRSDRPIRWLVLYAHHPDMMFGAIEMRRAGAKVIAHPDNRVLAAEGGADAMVANWHSVVGLQELLGFEYADQPDRPVTGWDTLRLGGTELVLIHPGAAHSPGDLMLWLPRERILFAGDILVEDGITMVVDGNSTVMLETLALIDSLAPRVVVPGHGRIPVDPASLTGATRQYLTALRDSMRAEVRRGTSMRRAVGAFPPADATRPVSPNSRHRRNAVRVYLEMEREALGIGEEARP
ncbi:MAG: MBL fold metallo-hydrolase [Gemmatimonadota bacterium]|nr:MBL fold metallo-hydrolase [Gemmatimonadota bacterium]MDH5198361.1 MBL fold metallo-hydrolase [Gemmatimonadota bacterium]